MHVIPVYTHITILLCEFCPNSHYESLVDSLHQLLYSVYIFSPQPSRSNLHLHQRIVCAAVAECPPCYACIIYNRPTIHYSHICIFATSIVITGLHVSLRIFLFVPNAIHYFHALTPSNLCNHTGHEYVLN